LAGLEQVIDSQTVRQVLSETGRVNPRACELTHEVIMWVVLAMGIFTNLPIRQVFKQTRFARAGETSPCRSSLCHARRRLGVAPVRRLFEQTVRPLATPQTPGAFYRGMRLMGIDGVVLNLPDRPANDTTFGRPSGGHRGAGAFPQLRKVSLVELGTHVEVAFVAKPITTGEQAVLPALLKHVPKDALLLEDRGFFSYEHWKMAISLGIRLLVRVKSNLILRPFQRLPDGSYLAKIYPKPYDRLPDRLDVRWAENVVKWFLSQELGAITVDGKGCVSESGVLNPVSRNTPLRCREDACSLSDRRGSPARKVSPSHCTSMITRR
jgi:hypothetical protein